MTNSITLATSAASIAPLHIHGSNSHDLAADRRKLLNDVSALGKTAGIGSRGLVLMAAYAVRGAAEELLSSDEPKATPGAAKPLDDAAILFGRYSESYAKQTIASLPQQHSKLRAIIKMGELTHKTGVDTVKVFHRTCELWKAAKEAKSKVVGEYKAVLQVAYAQNKQPNKALSDKQIIEAMQVEEKIADEMKLIKAAISRLEEAFELRDRNETYDAIGTLRSLLGFVENAAVHDAKLAQLAALKAELGIAA